MTNEQELRRAAFEIKFEGDFEGQLQRYDGGGAYVDETVDWTWHGFNAACDWMAARPDINATRNQQQESGL